MTPVTEAIFNLNTSDKSIVRINEEGLKEFNPEALAGKTVILGISMNNIKLAEGQLFAALKRLHEAKVAKVIMATGGELMGHSIAAQQNVLTLIANAIAASESAPVEYVRKMGISWKSETGIKTPQDKHIVGSAHMIGDLWAAEPAQKATFDEMKKRGLDFEIKHWHHFSSKYEFDSFVAQIALAYYKPENLPEEYIRILSTLPGPQRDTLPKPILDKISRMTSTRPKTPPQSRISIEHDPKFVDSVNSVAMTHLLKHTRHETRKLQSLINAVLAPTTKAPQTAIDMPALDFLYALQGEETPPSVIQFLATSISFLCKELGLPSSSPLYYSQESNLPNTQETHQQLLASWLLLMHLSETCSSKEREALLSKLRVPAYDKLLREILTPKAKASGKKPTKSVPSESERLSFTEQESGAIKKYSKKQIPQLKVHSFARRREKAEKIEALAKELDTEIETVLEFMRIYISEPNTGAFFVLAHNLMKSNDNKDILKRYIKRAHSEGESASDLIQTMIKEIFENHSDVSYESFYENLKTIFYNQRSEMFAFLLKLRFAQPELQKNVRQFLSIAKVEKTKTFKDSEEVVRDLREVLLTHFAQTGLAQELQVKFLLFERAYENSPQFIMQFYLHAMLLSKQFVKETFNPNLTSIIYEYLNKLFTAWGIKLPEDNSKLIPISLEELEHRCEDTIFRILIESSIAYILEECGGFQFIARELGADFFAYPELIIEALWLAREKVFATRDGNFCARDNDLLRCLTYYLVTTEKASSTVAKEAVCNLSEQTSSSNQPSKGARTASNNSNNANDNIEEDQFTEDQLTHLGQILESLERSIEKQGSPSINLENVYNGLSYQKVFEKLADTTNSALTRTQKASFVAQKLLKLIGSFKGLEEQKQSPSNPNLTSNVSNSHSFFSNRADGGRNSVAAPEVLRGIYNPEPQIIQGVSNLETGLNVEFRK